MVVGRRLGTVGLMFEHLLLFGGRATAHKVFLAGPGNHMDAGIKPESVQGRPHAKQTFYHYTITPAPEHLSIFLTEHVTQNQIFQDSLVCSGKRIIPKVYSTAAGWEAARLHLCKWRAPSHHLGWGLNCSWHHWPTFIENEPCAEVPRSPQGQEFKSLTLILSVSLGWALTATRHWRWIGGLRVVKGRMYSLFHDILHWTQIQTAFPSGNLAGDPHFGTLTSTLFGYVLYLSLNNFLRKKDPRLSNLKPGSQGSKC